MDIKKDGISSFSIIVIFCTLIIIGVSSIPLLNLHLTPSRALPTLNVAFSWPDASAKVIEQEITSKLEGVFNSAKDIERISSVTSKSKGSITISFKKGVNIDAARFEIATLIRRVYSDLPETISYPLLSLGTGGSKTLPILTYTVNGSNAPSYIQRYIEDKIVPILSAIKGVNNIGVTKTPQFEWEILLNTNLIANLNINPTEVSTSINNYFRREVIGIGKTVSEGDNKTIDTRLTLQGSISESFNWSNIPIKSVDGRVIWLTDIATTSYREKAPDSYFRINGLNTVSFTVYAENGVNTLDLTKTVKNSISQIKLTLPNGYSIYKTNDTSEHLEKELMKIGWRTLFSITILLLFVFIVTRNLKYLAIITISLIANLTIAIIFYCLCDVEIHLYSLAGITVSFGILIDNSIIITDHIKRFNNRKAFIAILAATLTTIGSLSIIFFLNSRQQINLIDFSLVIIINLTVSIFIALLFIPSLIEKIKFKEDTNSSSIQKRRRIAKLTKYYSNTIVYLQKYKKTMIVIAVLGFGLPTFSLPSSIDEDSKQADIYNATIGSAWYQDSAKEIVDKVLGGSLRLFSEDVLNYSIYSEPQPTRLFIRGQIKQDESLSQLNEAILGVENFISRYDEIELFETSVNSNKTGKITIEFLPQFESGTAPYIIKQDLIKYLLNEGGVEWNVMGVGRAFNNSSSSTISNLRIILEGYNYDKLYSYAEQVATDLEKHYRIKKVTINGGDSGWGIKSLDEYYLNFNKEFLGFQEISINRFYNYLENRLYTRYLSNLSDDKGLTKVVLTSDQAKEFNIWMLKNSPLNISGKQHKLMQLGSIEKRKMGAAIYKFNQQYRLNVSCEFHGSNTLAKKVREKKIDAINKRLPMGYSAEDDDHEWGNRSRKQYNLLLLIIVIIFVITSILFESLTQPFIIVIAIPISYIGVFLTFYLFDFNFDQGGIASFILLSGIVVNSGIYIINDFNTLKRDNKNLSNRRLYVKAFNNKIVPISLTILSTILGLIPFVWLGQNEVFWFSFAIGSIGGLFFSLIAIVIYMPILIGFYREQK